MSPYRGLPLWHHGFGLLGGIGLASFIVSGWLSMNPNRWFSSLSPPDAVRIAYAGRLGAVGLDVPALAALGGPGARAMRFAPVGGRWWVIREDANGPAALGSPNALHPSNDVAFIAAASHAIAGARLNEAKRLTAYDAYWYPNGTERPLPVLRLIFDDPAATWLHIDPRDGTILNRLDRSGRINRWLFDAAHRLDLPGLTLRPDAREAVQWILNLLAAGVTVTGLVLGWRRVKLRTGR